MPETVHAAVGTAAVDDAVLRLLDLSAVDYADRFALDTAPPGTPDEWARAMFGDRPVFTERLIWEGLLRLRLRPDAGPEVVAGWSVGARGEDWIRMEARSPHLVARIHVQVDAGGAAVTTAMHYLDRRGARTWSALAPIHQRLAPLMLRAAARRRAEVLAVAPGCDLN